jgi:hypothetical protein
MNMKIRLKSALAGAAALALAGGLVAAVGGGTAFAAGSPPWQPPSVANGNPNAVATLTFYDATGAQIISGNLTDSPISAYTLASGAIRTSVTDNKATIFAAVPNSSQAPDAWAGTQLSLATTYPNAAAPGALGTSANPLNTGAATDTSLAGFISTHSITGDANAAYNNIVELRMKTSSLGNGLSATYGVADLAINSAAGTWSQVFPAPPTTITTTTTLQVTPASPQLIGTSVSLTVPAGGVVAASGPNPTNGSVKFFDGATQIGSTQAWSGAAASVSTTTLAGGSHSLTAQYVPSGVTYSGSTSSAVPYTITSPADATATALTVNPTSGNAGQVVTLTATVADTAAGHSAIIPVGSVSFFDNGAAVAFAGPVAVNASGVAGTTTTSLGEGNHSIVAVFTPTSSANFTGSSSQPVTAQYTAVSACVPRTDGLPGANTCQDPQTITVTVAAGTLTISSPYTPTNPFNLGTMVLNANGTALTASAGFGTLAVNGSGITVTDTRSGGLPWTAHVQGSNFTDLPAADSISAHGLSFNGLADAFPAGNSLIGKVTLTAVPDVGAGGDFATTAPNAGDGTVWIVGTMALTAPSSTNAGTYTATVTFTVG